MLVGTAAVETLAADAAIIKDYFTEAIEFTDVVCLQMTLEMRNRAREAVLPPGLHPTVPATLSLQAWAVNQSPWGAFRLVICRVGCRSGVRARGFTTAVYASNADAVSNLRAQFGFPAQVASIQFRHSYDGADIKVSVAGKEILAIAALDPEPMGVNDVQYTGALNLAHTPNGLRLVQLEANHQASRVERLKARLQTFDAQAFGNQLLDPYWAISASISKEAVTFPPIRFVCRPNELAFTGTETI